MLLYVKGTERETNCVRVYEKDKGMMCAYERNRERNKLRDIVWERRRGFVWMEKKDRETVWWKEIILRREWKEINAWRMTYLCVNISMIESV